MKKRLYKAPAVKKVRLVVKDSVLASCHSSPNLDPKQDTVPCSVIPCFTP